MQAGIGQTAHVCLLLQAGLKSASVPGNQICAQPSAFNTRRLDAGCCASFSAGRRGRASSSPPQLGQLPCSTASAHSQQKVHSNEQIRASAESAGKSRLQHSQLGRSCSIGESPETSRSKAACKAHRYWLTGWPASQYGCALQLAGKTRAGQAYSSGHIPFASSQSGLSLICKHPVQCAAGNCTLQKICNDSPTSNQFSR